MSERKYSIVCAVLALLIVAGVVLCPFIRSMQECTATDMAVATCVMVVAVVVEIAVVKLHERHKRLTATIQIARLRIEPSVLRYSDRYFWPPGSPRASFSTPIRI